MDYDKGGDSGQEEDLKKQEYKVTKDEDYSSDDASSKVFQHNLGDYPVPKPRLKTQMMKKEDGDSEAPPLPPRRYRQSDYRPQQQPAVPPETYINMSSTRNLPKPTSRCEHLTCPENDEDSYEFPAPDRESSSKLNPMAIPLKSTYINTPRVAAGGSDQLYENTRAPASAYMPDNITVTRDATKRVHILLSQKKNMKLPEQPPSSNRSNSSTTPQHPERSTSAEKVEKYKLTTPDADQRPILLDVDNDREILDIDPNGDYDETYADIEEVAEDKAFKNLPAERAPITDNKKSIFYLLKKAYEYPGTNYWKTFAQRLDKAKTPFLESNESNESLLTVSSRLGNLDLLLFLLRHNGDLTEPDKRNMYPIHTAAFYGHDVLVRYMVNHEISINMPGNKGNTPLHYATVNRKIATIEYLIVLGANVNARNHAGKKPYDYAKEGRFKKAMQLLQDAMTKTVGKPFDMVRRETENNPVPRLVQEQISLVRQDMEHQKKEVKKDIESLKDKTEQHDQKITEIEMDYTQVRDTYHSQLMEKLERLERQPEPKYEYTYMHQVIPPVGVPHSQPGMVLQKRLSNPGPEALIPQGKPSLHLSQTCPDFTRKDGEQHIEPEYYQLDDVESVKMEVPNRGKLSKDAKDKLQRNYAKIVRNAKIKRIDAELLSEFVIDFDTNNHWNSCKSDSEVARQFVQILRDGTVEMCNKAKEILKADNQEDIADLLP